MPFEQLLGDLRENVVPFGCINGHPRFFAFVPGGGTFPGMLADLIASALNFEVSSWMEAAGPSRVEAIVIDWFKQWIGYPPAAAGCAGLRRIGRQPDGARLRPRGDRRSRCGTT